MRSPGQLIPWDMLCQSSTGGAEGVIKSHDLWGGAQSGPGPRPSSHRRAFWVFTLTPPLPAGPWKVRAGQSLVTDTSTTTRPLNHGHHLPCRHPCPSHHQEVQRISLSEGHLPKANLLSARSGLDEENFLDPWEGGWREAPMKFRP